MTELIATQSVEARAFSRRIELLARRSRVSIVSNVVIAAILTSLCFGDVPWTANLFWLGTMAAIVGLRYIDIAHYLRHPEARPCKAWARRFAAGALATGLCWAAGVVLFMVADNVTRVALMAFFVAGLTSGSMALGALYRPLSIGFSVPPILAMAAVLILSGETAEIVLGGVILFYCGALYHILTVLDRAVGETLAKAIENEDMAQSLRVALARAEAARAAQTQLVANVSHEIRTPMNAVIGMIDLARMCATAENRNSYLDVARSSAGSLLHMLNDLLELSRLDLGKISVNREPMSPPELVRSVAALFRPDAEQSGLSLKVVQDWPSRLAVIGDNNRCRQILVNLVGNAVKFTERGEIAILLALAAEDGDDLVLKVSVADTGPGIPEEHRETIFERFHQVRGNNDRTHQGTGLGLAISRELAQAMGGEITVESTLGQGSTFTLTLPCRRLTEGALPIDEMPQVVPTPIRTISSTDREHTHALIVDDNEVNCILISTMLAQADIGYEIANNGQEALDRLTNGDGAGRIDVVLMDVQMPVMDGLEATRRIRNLDNDYRDVPIVAITANAFKEQRTNCFAVGMDGFVVKPIDTDQMVAEIHQAIDGKPQRVSA